MALPVVPIVLASGFAGVSGFFTGSLLSDKLSTAAIVIGAVVGLFLIFILAQRFKLSGSLLSMGVT